MAGIISALISVTIGMGSQIYSLKLCFDNAAWSDDDDVTFSPTTYNSVLYDFFDNTLGCSLINPTQSTDRPNIKMEVCSKDLNGLTVSWTPATGLSDPNIADPIVSKHNGTDHIYNCS